MSTEFVSALQELIRTWIQGMVVPVGASLIIIARGIDTEVGGFNINWLLAVSVLASGAIYSLNTAIVSAVDKYFHKKGVETVLDIKVMYQLKK